ncbi:hypothetical protein C1H46_033152 [Malus baccata]|uniref:Prolamin-like domain-containing protein n=1 Tax=Malus baccata TaxID=106549 RepID=A0A540L498_MALBA|nr:hypothetical protein C1H46_033152 [Malus baccata]
MMKGGGVAAFFFLFCLALAQCSAASYSKAPAPPKTRAAAPVYSCWHHDPKLVNCLGAYHTASATCYHEIWVSYWTRKVAVQQDCCKAIVEMEDDCANYMFSASLTTCSKLFAAQLLQQSFAGTAKVSRTITTKV